MYITRKERIIWGIEFFLAQQKARIRRAMKFFGKRDIGFQRYFSGIRLEGTVSTSFFERLFGKMIHLSGEYYARVDLHGHVEVYRRGKRREELSG